MKYFLLAVLIPLSVLLNAQEKTKSTQGSSKQGSTAQNGSVLEGVEKYPKVKWRKKLKIARKCIADGSYFNALAYLNDVYQEKPDKIDVPHLLAECNRYLRDYQAAEKYYQAVIAKDPEAYVSDQFYLGQMQKMNGKYEDAKQSFANYLKVSLGKKDPSFKTLAKIEIAGCDTALALMKTPTKAKVVRVEGEVNKPLQDFAPKPLKDNRLLFSSQKSDTAVNLTLSKANYGVSLFTAEKTGKAYTGRTILPSPPNDKDVNICNGVLSGDEKTLIFTRCPDTINVGNMVKCQLYRTTKKNALEWNTPEELKKLNNEAGTTTHPAFGVDVDGNDILYFVSDRQGPGSKGGLDIYYAKINTDGTFGAIQNAGPEINTPGDDVTPHYDNANKILYFSSDGHPSIGGLDVFKAPGTPGHWGAVTNAGIPVNSQADDLYFALDQKAAKGFLVSNRTGTTSPLGATCCDDIWTVVIHPEAILKATYVKRGDPTNTPIAGVDASLYKVTGNNFEFVANTKTGDGPFYFELNRSVAYKINGNKEGYWPAIDNITVSEEDERDTIEQTFYLDPVIRIHIKIPNVYFAFDKSNVIDFYKGQIDSVVQILNEHPGYVVEIQGYTDSKGSDEYNEKLSMRRANEVKNFLVKKKKIADNRIVTKWFGEKNPAVPNELPNGEDDPEGRARNRRVEFKIIPDKPEEGLEFENTGEPVKAVKTGPGFTYGRKKK